MLIEDILAAAGIEARETCFLQAPSCTHACWGDQIRADGSDYDNEIYMHDYTLELYELPDAPDPDAHARLRAVLDSEGIGWEKSPRVFLLDTQLFLTTYSFSCTERRL